MPPADAEPGADSGPICARSEANGGTGSSGVGELSCKLKSAPRCVTEPGSGFCELTTPEPVSATSKRSWRACTNAARAGRPQDKAEDYRDAALAETARNPEGPVSALFIGGGFCEMEFAGDPERIR